MWPNLEWWTSRGYRPANNELTKELPNKWELCVSTSEPGISTKPPIDGQTLYVTAYEPDGTATTISFAMQRNSNIDPERMLAALLKLIEYQILA